MTKFINMGYIPLIAILILVLSSCNMTAANSPFSDFAQGSKLPAEFAIASGNVGLMLGCLAGLDDDLQSGGLSNREAGEIALDMIDLLAVLSQVMPNLVPYLIEGDQVALLNAVDDFYDPAGETYLKRIGRDSLIEYGLNAEPSPLQLLWGALGFVIYEQIENGVIAYGGLTTTQSQYDAIMAEAVQQAAEVENPEYYLAVLTGFREAFGEL